jgi:hypothetical protein
MTAFGPVFTAPGGKSERPEMCHARRAAKSRLLCLYSGRLYV